MRPGSNNWQILIAAAVATLSGGMLGCDSRKPAVSREQHQSTEDSRAGAEEPRAGEFRGDIPSDELSLLIAVTDDLVERAGGSGVSVRRTTWPYFQLAVPVAIEDRRRDLEAFLARHQLRGIADDCDRVAGYSYSVAELESKCQRCRIHDETTTTEFSAAAGIGASVSFGSVVVSRRDPIGAVVAFVRTPTSGAEWLYVCSRVAGVRNGWRIEQREMLGFE